MGDDLLPETQVMLDRVAEIVTDNSLDDLDTLAFLSELTDELQGLARIIEGRMTFG